MKFKYNKNNVYLELLEKVNNFVCSAEHLRPFTRKARRPEASPINVGN